MSGNGWRGPAGQTRHDATRPPSGPARGLGERNRARHRNIAELRHLVVERQAREFRALHVLSHTRQILHHMTLKDYIDIQYM